MRVPGRLMHRLGIRIAIGATLAAAQFGGANLAGHAVEPPSIARAAGSCALNSPGGTIQHVIQIQFDNTHFTRDTPNVPSDLEQMPNLLNFMKNNGVILANHHTPLISHTATDILTTLTGVYGDRHGVPVSNSFRYFNPDGSSNTGVSFAYWTAPLFDPSGAATDQKYNMLTADGKNAPAPWVPYTRAGCNVGAVATANTVLENTAIDIPTVFGAGSDQAAEVKSNPAQAFADFVGIGVHCAKDDPVCSATNGGRPDILPDEPGGYTGYNGLFGHKYVAPVISPGGPLTDLNGKTIADAKGNVGFPGFDGMSAAVSLSYVAAMQEHGIPVTYAYISDAHDNHTTVNAYGPGEAGYVAQLKAYDDAFGKFFARLQSDGITPANTLFVFTADENDHFVGGAPSPANCDGVTIPCTYRQIGEVNVNLTGLIPDETAVTSPFKVHADDAPTFYLNGNPAPTSTTARNFERAVWNITATNPMTGTQQRISSQMADPVEMKLLHMVTADPARTPTFTLFANPDYFLTTGSACAPAATCVTQNPAFAWNHGDVTSDITTTWLGMVGPGVKNAGVDRTTWSDHTDVRPTALALTGLKDDYQSDGRVLYEDLTPAVQPAAVSANLQSFLQLARTYKQLYATVGQFGLATLQMSTRALSSGGATDDSTYAALEAQLASLGAQRDALTGPMAAAINAAEFGGVTPDAAASSAWIMNGNNLLRQVVNMGGGYSFEVGFRSAMPGQGAVLFGTGPGCIGLVGIAMSDKGAGGASHDVTVTGNDLAGTVGDVGIIPGTTYWYENITFSGAGVQIDNNNGACYSITVPGP